jgi:hypothetical protein
MMIARERYRKAQKVGNTPIENWVQNWERALAEAKQSGLGEVQESINVVYGFLAAAESIVSGFSTLWCDKIIGWL